MHRLIGATALMLLSCAPGREAVREERGLSEEEARACMDQIDRVRSSLPAVAFGGSQRTLANAELENCVIVYRQRNRGYSADFTLAPRQPGEPPRNYDERLADERAARAAADARVDALRAATPLEVRRRASSAALCRYATWRARVVAAVEREHKYARETGVEDLSLLQRLKVQLAAIDAGAEELRAAFAAKRIKPESCSIQAIAELQRCVWLQAGGGIQALWNFPRDEGAPCEHLKPYLAYLGQG